MKTCSERRNAERSALAADVLRGTSRLRLQVRGESMLPTLWPRDVVEISSCSIEEARPGEIVLALRDGRFFLHRLRARLGAGGFLLQGDSMPVPDPRFPDDALLGRLVFRGDRHGIPLSAENDRARRLANPHPILALRPWSWVIGRLLCYCRPARRLALKLHAFTERRWDRAEAAEAVPAGGTIGSGRFS